MRRLSSIFLIVAIAGCGGDKSNAPKWLEGRYEMRTINGANLPAILYDYPSGQHAEITGGSITLTSGGTFSAPWSFRVTDNGTVNSYAETCTGTFTRTGNHVVMLEVDNGGFCGGQYDGDWDGADTFTAGDVVYRR